MDPRRSASRSSCPCARCSCCSAFAVLVALAVLSLGTLLSIFVAGGARARPRPDRRRPGASAAGSAAARRSSSSPALFAAVFVLVLVTAGPAVGPDQGVHRVAAGVLGRAARSRTGSRARSRRRTPTTRSARRSRTSPPGLPDAATALLGIAGGVFGSVLSLVTLTFLSLFLLMERPTITEWLFGFTPPAVERRWRPVVEESIRRRLVVAARQRRDLDRGGDRRRRCRRGRSGCRSRSCWP